MNGASRRALIVANWKQNPSSLREARELMRRSALAAAKARSLTVVLCPPTPFLAPLAAAHRSLAFAAQDCSSYDGGAHTGEHSAAMLASVGARFCIIGHSERRAAGETSSLLHEKLRLALKAKLVAILCVGEEERDRSGHYLKIIERQLSELLHKLPASAVKSIVLAYEPVWAIGAHASGADTPEAFRELAIYIRKVASSFFGSRAALALPVLYGGSVTPENASSFLTEGEADGLLVGRASQKAELFAALLKSVQAAR